MTEASEKVTKKWPKESRKRKKWSNSFCRPPFAAPWSNFSRRFSAYGGDQHFNLCNIFHPNGKLGYAGKVHIYYLDRILDVRDGLPKYGAGPHAANSLLPESEWWGLKSWVRAIPQIEGSSVATPAAPYRSLPGPPGPESRKSLQRVSKESSGPKKCPKQSRNSLRSLKIDCFETPETASRLFRTLFGPRETLWRLFRDSGPGEPGRLLWGAAGVAILAKCLQEIGEKCGEILAKFIAYHWGHKDDLPNLYPRRIILGNSMCFFAYKRELPGELILNCLTKITLPKFASNKLGNVFVPNGIFVLQFSGIATKKFTKNPRHFHSAPNRVSLSLSSTLGAGGHTKSWVRRNRAIFAIADFHRKPLSSMFWISLLVSFLDFLCFSGRVNPKIHGKESKSAEKALKIARAKQQRIPKKEGKGRKQGNIAI